MEKEQERIVTLSLVKACNQVVGGMKSAVQYYRVNRRQISFIKFILEAYDNMAVVTTLDPSKAIVQVAMAPGCETIICSVLNAFSHEFEVVALDRSAASDNEGSTVANEYKKAPH